MTIRDIFTGRVLARISILPKISSFGCLHCVDRSLYDIRESYREQSRWFLMLSNCFCGTLVSYNDRSAQRRFKSNERTNTPNLRVFALL